MARPRIGSKGVASPPVTEQFRMLAEHATDVVFQTDADRLISWVSPNVTRALGWTPQQLLGTRLVDLVHPDDRARTESDRSTIYAGTTAPETSIPFLLRLRREGGDYVWMSGTATTVTDPVTGASRVITGARNVEDLIAARDATAASERRFRTALDAFQEPFLTYAPVHDMSGAIVDLVYTYLNTAAERLLDRTSDATIGWGLAELFPSVRELGILDSYVSALTTGRPSVISVQNFDENGVRGSFELTAYPFGLEIIVMAREVTEKLAMQEAMARSETRYRLLAENAMDMVFSLDMHALIEWVSPSAERLLGYDPSELMGSFGGKLIHAEDLGVLLETASQARAGVPASCRIRMLAKSGDHRWVEATPRGLYGDDGELVGGVIGVRDIHDEMLAREAWQHEVEFDDLTGLAKRPLALQRIQDIIDTRQAPGWALLCMGVDGMTAVNQAYTYAAGDDVLRAVADRLVAACGASDRVARIAGDEFAILMRDVVTASDAATTAERLLAGVRGPVAVGDIHVDVTACIGIALAGSETAEGLLRDATAAMRQAAALGSNRWEFLDGDIGEQSRETLRVQRELAEGVELGLIHTWLMPIATLVDGQVVGHEALVRWVLADGTVIGPDGFLAVAERSGLILQIDRLVLAQALESLSGLPSDQHVAVNVSASTLSSGTLIDRVTSALADAGVDAHRLHLEVTETALLQVTDTVRDTMEQLAGLGVAWWVDDFGTGFSSISHLRDLPISGLKLDRTFTAGLTLNDTHATRLAQGLAGLAAGLGLQTVAEGVETIEQVNVLMSQGWQMGQGWLYGQAAPPAV
jgi:diguanylate cyclase (GGDEF)-like protein/PAS domain S-box-containing protein